MTKRAYDIETLIRVLGDRMTAVAASDEDEERSFSERLRLLETIGRTCTRLATLIAQQEKSESVAPDRLNHVLEQVLTELRSGARDE